MALWCAPSPSLSLSSLVLSLVHISLVLSLLSSRFPLLSPNNMLVITALRCSHQPSLHSAPQPLLASPSPSVFVRSPSVPPSLLHHSCILFWQVRALRVRSARTMEMPLAARQRSLPTASGKMRWNTVSDLLVEDLADISALYTPKSKTQS